MFNTATKNVEYRNNKKIFYGAMDVNNQPRRELTMTERKMAFMLLWGKGDHGRISPEMRQNVARIFRVHVATINKLWRVTTKKIDEVLKSIGEEYDDATEESIISIAADDDFWAEMKRQSMRGKWKVWNDMRQLKRDVREVPLEKRRTWASLAQQVDVPRSTLHYLYKKGGVFCQHWSPLKPLLTDKQQGQRHHDCEAAPNSGR